MTAEEHLNEAKEIMVAMILALPENTTPLNLLTALGMLSAHVLMEVRDRSAKDDGDMIADSWLETVKSASGATAHSSFGFGTRH
jgi:hypothetical protein